MLKKNLKKVLLGSAAIPLCVVIVPETLVQKVIAFCRSLLA